LIPEFTWQDDTSFIQKFQIVPIKIAVDTLKMLLLNIKSISAQWDELGFVDLMLHAIIPVSSQQKN
jgi:hypothetical protein